MVTSLASAILLDYLIGLAAGFNTCLLIKRCYQVFWAVRALAMLDDLLVRLTRSTLTAFPIWRVDQGVRAGKAPTFFGDDLVRQALRLFTCPLVKRRLRKFWAVFT